MHLKSEIRTQSQYLKSGDTIWKSGRKFGGTIPILRQAPRQARQARRRAAIAQQTEIEPPVVVVEEHRHLPVAPLRHMMRDARYDNASGPSHALRIAAAGEGAN